MKRYAICLGYLPTFDYSGFSNQLHDTQNIYTVVFSTFKRARLINLKLDQQIHYASRTDRGVGALSQVIAFNAEKTPILSEINSYLPDSIRALSFTNVSSKFHPRRDAQLRTYSYFLTVNGDFNLTLARKVLKMLVGRHDFHNFAKRDPSKEINTVKNLETADISIVGEDTYQIRLSSKSFLWQQIRRIVNHVIEVATGIYSLEYTRQLLSPKPAKVKPTPASPENLILENIQYQDVEFIYDQKALQSFIYTLKEQLLDAKAKTAVYTFLCTNLQDRMG